MKGPSKRRFEAIFERGIRVSGTFFRILSLPGKGFVGFATPRSLGARPLRNHVRRRVQEAFRSERIPAGLDIVVQIKASAKSADFEGLRADARTTLDLVESRWAEQSASS